MSTGERGPGEGAQRDPGERWPEGLPADRPPGVNLLVFITVTIMPTVIVNMIVIVIVILIITTVIIASLKSLNETL